MYNIIVVDDEKLIGKGLKSFFEKGDTGFVVIESFEDGLDALEYLRKNHDKVDVVITDIKMVELSGLDLVKIIHKEKMDIITILLSGYKEFEYARLALNYGVYSYLLKPVKFKELDELFLNLKKTLDEKKQNKTHKLNELQSLITGQFLVEIDAGIYCDNKQLYKRAQELHFPNDFLQSYCVYVKIQRDLHIVEHEQKWKYGIDRLEQAVINAINNEYINCYIVQSDAEFMSLFILPVVYKTETNLDNWKKDVNEMITYSFESLHKMFDVDIKVIDITFFDSIIAFAKQAYISPKIEQLDKIRQLLIANMMETDPELITVTLRSLVNKISKFGEKQIVEILTEFCIILKSFLNKNVTVPIENCCEIDKANNSNESSVDNNILIECAINYIKNNYQRDISLSDVAAQVYLSPVYFGRIFKIYTGENFTDYLIKIRLEKATELLNTTNLKICEVGKMVGYSNIKYFIRLFKKRLGQTPGKYKNTISKSAIAFYDNI